MNPHRASSSTSATRSGARRSSRPAPTRRSRAWVYLNGHEWAKRQAERAGLGFEALDNGFGWVADADTLAAICNRLCARDVRRFFARWQARLSSPFDAADHRRGNRYALAFRQLELSDTRVFDRPAAGRAWFEQTISDQLALGRPDNIAIVFGRKVSRRTPGRFHTRVIARGVEPAIQVHYKASKVKQYFKEGRALRTETTVNDTYDFGIGRLLTTNNWERSSPSAMTSTNACSTPNCRRAPAPPTPRRCNASCCRPSRTANPPPGCASATRG
jgi:hypothetical protein